ncbi:MAG: BatA and WFA domain-containing protein [Candidatus Hydrogenedentes bacterium]|nr:BatA and WFA domain-containing protein [Candidatus Hydrogenedentota bacterium]
MNLTNLIFTNPALWAGALALFAPVLIHLLTRRTPRRLVFPTLRFIKAAQASQSSLFRIRHLLMLIVRTAFVLFLLLAFLKPVMHAGVTTPPELRGRSAHVIVLDASLSMSFQASGNSPFAKAQSIAVRIAESLAPEDSANLIIAGGRPTPSFTAPASNPIYLKRDILSAKPTMERADVDAALAEAVNQLGQAPQPFKVLHIVSDFQRANWSAAAFKNVPPEVKVLFLNAGDTARPNTAIAEITLSPRSPVVSEDTEITCKVANYGPEDHRIPVQLQFGEDAPLQRDVDVTAGATASVTFRVRAGKPAFYEGIVSIPDDGLPADNRRFFTMNVSDRVHVAFLNDTGAGDRNAGSRALLRALDPYYDDATRSTDTAQTRGKLQVHAMPSDDFDTFAASNAHIVVIEGVLTFSEKTADTLLEYLRNGGAVVYFIGDAADAANLTLMQTRAANQLTLPFTPGAVRDFGGGATEPDSPALTFAQANFDDPMLKRFRDLRELAEVRFTRALQTERSKGKGQVLIRFNDETIAMAKAPLGAGTMLLCNFSLARNASDFARRPLFVPFVHELLLGMRPLAGSGRESHVGQAASGTIPMPATAQSVRFTGPSGVAENATITRSETEAAVIITQTREPGFYRVYAGDRCMGAIPVNIDPRESNLESLTEAQLLELTQRKDGGVEVASGSDASAIMKAIEGKPLWHYFLVAALCALALEQGLLLALRR